MAKSDKEKDDNEKDKNKKSKKKETQEELEARLKLEADDEKKNKKKKIIFNNKKDFNMDTYKKLRTVETDYKEDSWIEMSEAFQEVIGFPGFPEGHVHEVYGPSDCGKTTMLLEMAVGAQKKGILPIFVITEKKWSWERAEIMGIDRNFSLFRDDLSFIEEACDFINIVLEDQKNGNLPHDIVFLWDSIGATPSKAEWEAQEEHEKQVAKVSEAGGDMKDIKKSSGGMMVAARVIRERIQRVIQHKITATRNINFPYNATLFIVNHGYISPNPMPGLPPSLVPYGGGGLKYALSMMIRQGKPSGIHYKHKAKKNGVDITWGTEVPLVLEKNHINGIVRHGDVIVTPYGYIKADKDSIEEYKKAHKEDWDTAFEKYFTPNSNSDEDIDVDPETGETLS